jgi:hypothetical protein
VVVGLIGTGQEIHAGEEGGLGQWRRALEGCAEPARWTVHAPAALEAEFVGSAVPTRWEPSLSLDTELRYHLTPKLQSLVAGLLEGTSANAVRRLADELHAGMFRLLVTRDLEAAKSYARERYADAPLARFGLLASSKDRELPRWGVDNTFQTTKMLRVGPWYNERPEHPQSCRRLATVATEFSSQGLELDLAILAWGSDLLRQEGEWSNARSRGTKDKVHDPLRMRRNVYRVLLTRGRDGTVVFVPPDPTFDETARYLEECGFRGVEAGSAN